MVIQLSIQKHFNFLHIYNLEESIISSMLSYDMKMFKEKPYTQCFECVQGNRLKCKKCMENLIENVLQHRSCFEGSEKRRKIGPKNTQLLGINKRHEKVDLLHTRKSMDLECEVNTIYGLWMDRMKSKRQRKIDPCQRTIENWPIKKAASSQKMEKIQSPKFETWQARLLNRFSSISAQHLRLNLPHKFL